MEPKVFTFTFAAAFGLLAEAIHPYNGPIVISLLAALARLVYSECPVSWANFLKLWGMTIFVSVMMLHIGRWQGWSTDLSVPIWGFCAFLSKEIFDAAKAIPAKIVPILINRYSGKRE